MNYKGVENVKFIAGQTFQTEYGWHEAGKEVKEAEKFPNLEVLVSARFLWPYAPDAGYDWLPPHLFSSVQVRDEVLAELRGDQDAKKGVPQFPSTDSAREDEKPQVISQAEAEAEAQLIIREKIKIGPEKTDEPSDEVVVDPAPAKKRTAPKEK